MLDYASVHLFIMDSWSIEATVEALSANIERTALEQTSPGGQGDRFLRVCLVSFGLPPRGGGEGTYVWNLARGLVGAGHSVTLRVPSGARAPDGAPRGLAVEEVSTLNAPTLRVASFVLGVRRSMAGLAGSGFDVAHFAFDFPTLPLPLGGGSVPTVATVHHLHFAEARSMMRVRPWSALSPNMVRRFLLTQVEKSTAARADRVVAVSEFTRRSLTEGGFSPSKVSVVPNGIDLAAFGGADGGRFARLYGLGESPYVIYVGRLEPSKGVAYLLSAFSGVRKSLPGARLVVVGGGKGRYSRSLRRWAESDAVVFTGYVDAELLRSAYAGASAVALPSLMEGSGMSLLEGMASGKPCLATRVGGVPEVVEDGVTGLLVPAADVPSLSRAMVRLLKNRDEAEEMGRRGRKRVAESFGIASMTAGTVEAYRLAMAG